MYVCMRVYLYFHNCLYSGNEEDNTIDENAGDVIKVKDVLRMRLRKAYPWLENNLPNWRSIYNGFAIVALMLNW